MEVFENGIIRREALEQLKREVVDPNVVDRCKEWLDPSLHGIVDDIKQKFGNVRDRIVDKAKGEDVFNDVETMFEIFFPNNNKQVDNPRLKTCYGLLRSILSCYYEVRKNNDPNSDYKSYMTINSGEISEMGADYKKDYNVARFAFIKELLEEVFKYSLVSWSNRKNTKSCWKLLENVLHRESNILLFCSDVYALDVALQKQIGKDKATSLINKCTLILSFSIKNMAGVAMEICKELSENCMLYGDEGINALFNLYSIDEKSYHKYKQII